MDDANDVEVAADAIATKLTDYMISGFTAKEGRPPTTEEIEQLFDELTPDRIAEMLGETTEAEGKECDDDNDEDCDDEDAEEIDEEVDESKELNADAVGDKESTEKSTVIDVPTLENNENKRQLTSPVVDSDKRIRIE